MSEEPNINRIAFPIDSRDDSYGQMVVGPDQFMIFLNTYEIEMAVLEGRGHLEFEELREACLRTMLNVFYALYKADPSVLDLEDSPGYQFSVGGPHFLEMTRESFSLSPDVIIPSRIAQNVVTFIENNWAAVVENLIGAKH